LFLGGEIRNNFKPVNQFCWKNAFCPVSFELQKEFYAIIP